MQTGAPSKRDGRSKKRPGVEVQRKRIVDAAVELFVASGSRSVSISKICTAADVSRPTFYRCFEDKDALIAWIYRYAIDDPVGEVLTSLRERPSLAYSSSEARDTVNLLVDTILDRGRFAQLIFVESRDPDSPAREIVESAHEHAIETMMAWAERDPDVASRMLLKSMLVGCQWITHETMRRGADPESREAAKEAIWQLTVGVLARLLK